MDYIALSKILPFLIYPFNVAMYLLIIAFILMWRHKTRWGTRLLGAAVAILLVSGNPSLATALYSNHERIYLPTAISETPNAEAIVVLGGAIGLPIPPRISPDLSTHADRVLHTSRLFKAGKAPLVIISSGNVFVQPGIEAEGVYISELLQEWGVPESAIIVEEGSRNTYENAINTKAILDRKNIKKILLVTSAMHMPRAAATFRSAGIDSIPSPTDYALVGMNEPTTLKWLPSANAIRVTTAVIHEKLGILMYHIRGWIE